MVMHYLKLPKHKQLREVRWQVLDVAVISLVASATVGLFMQHALFGLVIFGLSLLSVTLYLLLELWLEQLHATFSHHTHKHDPYLHDSRAHLFLWGAIIGGLAYLNFWLYFVRHGVTAGEIPATAPLYREAVILAGMTVAVCLLARAVHHRFHFSRKLELRGLHRARHLKAYLLAFLYTCGLLYGAVLLSPYGANISFALLALVPFLAAKEFHRFDRKHHRKNLLNLHQEIRQLKSESLATPQSS